VKWSGKIVEGADGKGEENRGLGHATNSVDWPAVFHISTRSLFHSHFCALPMA